MEKEILKQNVGIDIAKDDFKACFSVMMGNRRIVIRGSRTFCNNSQGFKEFVEWTNSRRYHFDNLHFTMEATGVYYESLAYFLWKDADCKVQVVLPNKAKNFAKSLDIKSKTDQLDAQILAQMGLERELRQWQPISPHLLELKQLTRERDMLVRSRTAAANQLHAAEHQGKPNKKVIARTKKHITLLDKLVKEIEKEAKNIVNQDDKLKQKFVYLQSIPGVGFMTAATVIAETGGFETFTGIKQLTSYAGLDVKIAESGMWKGKSRISKRGNSHIRKALYMSAIARVRSDKNAALFYENIKQRKGKALVALVAVERKMLGLMFSLWKNEQRYKLKF